VKEAFRDVSDSLVGYRQSRVLREQQELLFAAVRDARSTRRRKEYRPSTSRRTN